MLSSIGPSESKSVIDDSAFKNKILETHLYLNYELLIDEFEKDIQKFHVVVANAYSNAVR